MNVQFQTENGLTVIRPEFNSLDVSTARAFRREVMDNVPHDARTILDMTRVEFVDSTGCGAILGCMKYFHVEGAGSGGLKLCMLAPPVRALFEMVRLHKIVEIYNTKDEAVRAYCVAS